MTGNLASQLERRSFHRCPVGGCRVTDLPARLLMCAPHWHMVPPLLQRAVWDAYDHGRGVGSLALLHAQAAAIAAIHDREDTTHA
jgi:hypothetical protein